MSWSLSNRSVFCFDTLFAVLADVDVFADIVLLDVVTQGNFRGILRIAGTRCNRMELVKCYPSLKLGRRDTWMNLDNATCVVSIVELR